MIVKFTVPGEPQSKGRPRFSYNGRFVQTYTPDKTVNYENLVKLAWMQRAEDELKEPIRKLEGAIRAEIVACFPIPKSASKKKHAQMADGKIRPIAVKKDIDNVCKSVLDALNGIAYDDDRQVVEILAYKYYSENPKVYVTLSEIGG